ERRDENTCTAEVLGDARHVTEHVYAIRSQLGNHHARAAADDIETNLWEPLSQQGHHASREEFRSLNIGSMIEAAKENDIACIRMRPFAFVAFDHPGHACESGVFPHEPTNHVDLNFRIAEGHVALCD